MGAKMAVIANYRPLLALKIGLILDGEVDNWIALREEPNPNCISARAERDVIAALSWAHRRRWFTP